MSIVRREKLSVTDQAQVGCRKAIKKFTQTSRDRLRFQIRNAHCVWTCFTTLTYPSKYPHDGRYVKKHLNTLLTNMRRDYPGIRYMWWLEFQDRGAPHIHLITTCPLPGRMYVNPLWYSIVGSKDSRHLSSGADVRPFYGELLGYEIAEIYASKMDQKAKPPSYSKVGRYWGCSRNLTASTITISGLSPALAEGICAQVNESTRQEPGRIRSEEIWSKGDSSALKSTGFHWTGNKASAAVCHGLVSAYEQGLSEETSLNLQLHKDMYGKHPQLKSVESWSKSLELARACTRSLWEKQHGKPLYSPRYHTKVVLKDEGRRQLSKTLLETVVTKVPDGWDEGVYQERERITKSRSPAAAALSALEKEH